MSLTVVGVGLSPFVRKVRAVLAEKNLRYELDPMIPLNVPPEYKKVNPLGKIPCLKVDGKPLPDSSAIAAYLERAHPEPALYPSDPWSYGRAIWLEEYADGGVWPAGQPIFGERIVAKAFMNREPDEAKVKQAIETDLPPRLDYLEEQLGDADYFVDNRFGIADIAVASPFVNLAHGGYQVDAARWPRLAAFLERVHSRPSFKPLIEEERKALGL